MSFLKSLFSTSDKDEKNKMKIEYKTIIIGAKKELICTVKNNELLTSFLVTDGMSFYENIISTIDNVLNGNKENDELSMNIHKLEVNKNITKIIDKLSENGDTTEVETSALKSVLEEYAAKRQKFECENYVNYTSKDNNMIIKLPKEYKKDDVADYDFYAGYEDKLYLGMYVYNLEEYKGYTENQILNEQFSIMSKSRKMKVILNNQIKKYQNKITNTVVYLSKREGYVDTVISMSTIRFYSMPNYIVYVVQTCNEDYYNKNKEIIMTNLANIEPNDKEHNLKEELNNKIIKENNDCILSESGDFNLYLNYTDKVDFNGIQKFFEKYGLNVDVNYEKEDGYTRFSINSRTDKEAITPEFYCYGEKYNQYINDLIEDAKADDEYDSKFEKEVNNLKKANSYYMISIHSKEEAKYLLYITLYLAEQTDFIMIFDCYKGRYLSLEDIVSNNEEFQPCNQYTTETDLQNSILHISKIISHNDSVVINEINNLMNNKDIYIKSNERGIDKNCDNNTLFWLIMVDVLEKHNYVCERDWNDEFEDFIYFLSNLKTFDIDINNDIFNKDESIVEWCKIIDSKYEPKCIGCIDIDSDSYVLFVSNNHEINELKRLATEISKKVDYAKNC